MIANMNLKLYTESNKDQGSGERAAPQLSRQILTQRVCAHRGSHAIFFRQRFD